MKIIKMPIELSILGYGCMRLPVTDNKADKIDYNEASRLIHHAIGQGVNYIDTAYFYHAAFSGKEAKGRGPLRRMEKKSKPGYETSSFPAKRTIPYGHVL